MPGYVQFSLRSLANVLRSIFDRNLYFLQNTLCVCVCVHEPWMKSNHKVLVITKYIFLVAVYVSRSFCTGYCVDMALIWTKHKQTYIHRTVLLTYTSLNK